MFTLRCRRVAALLLFATTVLAPPLRADELQERRTEAGLRLFRTLLAADLDLQKKVANNQLVIAFFYVADARRATELASAFAGSDIRGLPVAVEVTNDPAFARLAARTPGGIFLAEPPPKAALQTIIRYGIDHHVIVYSPFEGHVENGVLGGLSIGAQVRPFLNQATLDASHILLKDFFLKVAKVYR